MNGQRQGELVSVRSTWPMLAERHYLGPTKAAGFGYQDEFGVAVFAAPRSRRLPSRWLELVRWCLDGRPNSGSQQWSKIVSLLSKQRPDLTTIVSYSDPSAGHDGALYRACNWLWAPTWLRLRPPPSGHGAWTIDQSQETKDRWVYPLCHDAERQARLTVRDNALQRKFPWCSYREPRWRGKKFNPATGGGNYKRAKLEGII